MTKSKEFVKILALLMLVRLPKSILVSKFFYVVIGFVFINSLAYLMYNKQIVFPIKTEASSENAKEFILTSQPQISPSPSPLIEPTITPTRIPTLSPLPVSYKFGVVVDDYSNQQGGLSSVQGQLGKPINTVSIFKQFGSQYNKEFIADDLAYAKSQGMKVQLSWEPWDPEKGMSQSTDYLTQIIQGQQDQYLSNFANAIKSYGGPVVMRFGHEMNGDWYPWGNRPSDYIAAYRYIVNFFRNAGVGNVTWMWCVNSENVPVTPISSVSQFYPGDDVVDTIGIDGFNFGNGKWRTFRDIFAPAYNYLIATYRKPLVIAEVASSESGGNKSTWVAEMFRSIPSDFPQMQELIWFNLLKEADWRINSTDVTLQSFIDNLH